MPDPIIAAETCANCRGPVSSTGPRPRSGRRYCMKPGCRAARQRDRYQLETLASGAFDRQAPTQCSCCQAPLKPRRWRDIDELGRWCTRARCRADRQAKRAATGEEVDHVRTIERLKVDLAFLGEVVMAHADDYYSFATEHCPECGLTTAIPDWAHQAADGSPCFGTLGDAEKRPVSLNALSLAWPFKREYRPVEEGVS